jgi:hypothetical protein
MVYNNEGPIYSVLTGKSVSAYYVAATYSYGGKYCEDGGYGGKPKYRKGTTNYYIYYEGDSGTWHINNFGDLGEPYSDVYSTITSNTPPVGSYSWVDNDHGSDLNVFNNFYTTANPPTLYTTYIHYGSIYNGKQVYSVGGRELKYESSISAWIIDDSDPDPDNPVRLYQNNSTSNTPPLSGWTVVNGSSPAPTFVGPNC